MALAGFWPHQAPPRQPSLVEGALERQVTHCWAPVVALRYATLAGSGPDQASPQLAPLVGAALMALAGTELQQALGWAALVTPVPQGYWRGWWNSGQVSSLAPDWVHTCDGIISVKEVAAF